ncbi:Hypothetical protein CKL_1827 [Clostridium kluyveri DSM 555]|nr:Hypothetical protein CKL_1827 [Clostridium kluyveri DSM 555]
MLWVKNIVLLVEANKKKREKKIILKLNIARRHRKKIDVKINLKISNSKELGLTRFFYFT